MTDTSMKHLDIEIVSTSTLDLPHSAQVSLSLLDTSLADAPAIAVAQLRLRCAGVMPIRLMLNYDSRSLKAGRRYVLGARIEQEDKLWYINTVSHPVDPDSVTGPLRVSVDRVAEPACMRGEHGSGFIDQQPDGIHGGNRTK